PKDIQVIIDSDDMLPGTVGPGTRVRHGVRAALASDKAAIGASRDVEDELLGRRCAYVSDAFGDNSSSFHLAGSPLHPGFYAEVDVALEIYLGPANEAHIGVGTAKCDGGVSVKGVSIALLAETGKGVSAVYPVVVIMRHCAAALAQPPISQRIIRDDLLGVGSSS